MCVRFAKTAICNRNAAHHRPDDADETLIGPTQMQVRKVRAAVKCFMSRAIHRSLIVARKSPNGRRGKNISCDHAMTEIRNKPYRRGEKFIIALHLFEFVRLFIKTLPAIEICLGRNPNQPLGKGFVIAGVGIVIG